MSDILCNYHDREAMLMAYLYGEIAPKDREAFDAHLTTCARCRVELNGLGRVRAQMARWAPPDYRDTPQTVAGSRAFGELRESHAEQRAATDARRPGWTSIPTWAQYVAAVLVLGVSAGAANLNIHYDAQNGLNVRTGWSHQESQGSQGSQGSAGSQSGLAGAGDLVSRSELTALEQQLRSEMHTASVPPAVRSASAASDAETLRRVRALLDETERRHERELALKVAEVMRDVNVQRQSDLRKIDQNIDQGRVEVLRNRQMLDYYMQRVSQRQ